MQPDPPDYLCRRLRQWKTGPPPRTILTDPNQQFEHTCGARRTHAVADGASVDSSVPVSYTHLDVYKRQDLLAGLTVALVLVPQSMAYAQLAEMCIRDRLCTFQAVIELIQII